MLTVHFDVAVWTRLFVEIDGFKVLHVTEEVLVEDTNSEGKKYCDCRFYRREEK